MPRAKLNARREIGRCPRCGAEGEHPRNYGRPQRDRGWCRECGSLWTIAELKKKEQTS